MSAPDATTASTGAPCWPNEAEMAHGCRSCSWSTELARLTAAGRSGLEQIAPGHVAAVRRVVFDRLTPEEVGHLAHLASALLDAASESPS